MVPYNFVPNKLKEYAQEHANSVRDHAREYVKSQKTKSRIDQVLAKARNQIWIILLIINFKLFS